MAAIGGSKKRKRDPSAPAKGGSGKPKPKHPKLTSSSPSKPPARKAFTKPQKPSKPHKAKPYHADKSAALAAPRKEPVTAREHRLVAKEKTEARKMKRRPNYVLEKELALLWEKMRSSNVSKEERSKSVSEALRKMNGKLSEIASSHVSARVLQTCVKYCLPSERETIFEELRPNLLSLAKKKYAVFLVKKVLDNAPKKQLEAFFSSLHGHVASLLRHTVGSAVVEHAFHLGNGSQKRSLLMEMYSTELQLFRDLTWTNAGRLVDVISKLGLQKSAVLKHMTSVIQPLLEKGIVYYSIIHTALVEYFTIADKTSAAELIQQLVPLLVNEYIAPDDDEQPSAPQFSRKKTKGNKSGIPLLVRMMRTRDGLKIGILCIKHGSAKEKKKIVRGIKGHIRKLALDQYGNLLLVSILSVVDDTVLVKKIVIRELQKILKELVLDRNGRRPILQLLHPLCPRYFGTDDLACLNLSVPSLCNQSEDEAVLDTAELSTAAGDNFEAPKMSTGLTVGSKKDQSSRRHELLVDSQLAQGLIENCIENAGELLRSNLGKEVIYEVAVGGADNLLQSIADKLEPLHQAIASQAALPKSDESEEEHVLDNFHSSRTIRKLVLDCPAFAATLWKIALKGKSEMWASGHSCKVLTAYLESGDSKVKDLANPELQPLIDRGVLKAPERKQLDKDMSTPSKAKA